MGKKFDFRVEGSNIGFLVLTACAFISILLQIDNIINTISGLDAQSSFKFNLIQITIEVTSSTYNHTYNIFNSVAIPILGGIIYNIYNMAKAKKGSSKYIGK